MSWKHLSAEARKTLQRCLSLGLSLRTIGKILGCSAAALCKERKRNTIKGEYCADAAHLRAINRRIRAARRKKTLSPALESYIFDKMQQYWSPEQVCGRLAIDYPHDVTMRISFKTIYRRIARAVKKRTSWCVLYHYLRLKRQRKSLRNHASRNHGPAGQLPSIDLRPAVVAEKKRFGDWESDLVCGPKGNGYIATFVERTTCFILAAQCAQKLPTSYKQAALDTLGKLSQGAVHTVTVDRGSEFFGYREIEKELGVRYYFCHPRCPNERGLNEQINGLLRQFFPKRTPLINIKEKLARAVALLNHRPRKKLGYRTPVEVLRSIGMEQVLTLDMTSS